MASTISISSTRPHRDVFFLSSKCLTPLRNLSMIASVRRSVAGVAHDHGMIKIYYEMMGFKKMTMNDTIDDESIHHDDDDTTALFQSLGKVCT